MPLSVNTLAYANDTSRSPDSFRYLGPANTFSVKDWLDVWRKAPIATADSAGKARSMGKLTRTMTDGTDPVGDGILKLESSIPADAARSEQEAMIDDFATWLLTAEAKDVLLDHEIVQS